MRTVLVCVVLAGMAGCGSAPPPVDTHDFDVRTIKDGEFLWVRHWSTRDADRIVSHFSEDAIWMAPHMPFANGREAIRSNVKQLVQDNSLAIAFEPARIDVAKSGELAYSQGTYSMTVTDPVTKSPVTDVGSYVRIYRRGLDKSWRAIEEIDTATPTAGAIVR